MTTQRKSATATDGDGGIVRAGVVLGLGLGGFVDGIVLHQIFQTHHMLSTHSDPAVANDIQLNVLADGLFHAGTFLLTILGIALLVAAWRRSAVPPSRLVILGSVVLGWGIFNLVEGVVNHHLLSIHRVWPDGPGDPLVWDLGFLALGLVLAVGGYLLVRRGRRSTARAAT